MEDLNTLVFALLLLGALILSYLVHQWAMERDNVNKVTTNPESEDVIRLPNGKPGSTFTIRNDRKEPIRVELPYGNVFINYGESKTFLF